jgi:hypothetical protein
MSAACLHEQLLDTARVADMSTSQLLDLPRRMCCALRWASQQVMSCWPAAPTAHEVPSAAAFGLHVHLSSPAQHQQEAADAAGTVLVSYLAPWALAAACPCSSAENTVGSAKWPPHDDNTAYSKQSVQAF